MVSNIMKWSFSTGILIHREQLTVVVSGRWSVNTGGRLSRFDLV